MAATLYAVLDRLQGASLAAALPQVGGPAQNQDILQIVDNNGLNILLNVDYLGVVHKPASGATTKATNSGQTRLGQFVSRLDSSASVAQLFADAFFNPSQLDIIQVQNFGGNISYWLDYLGVAHGA